MARFIALPVGQGDAFYLDRGDWSVLIDGGRAQDSFGETFQRVTGVSSVDVVVCTHNDADHANGIIGFLESGLACTEVWLPARWLDALPGVLRSFVDVFIQLAEEVSQTEIDESLEFLPPPGPTPLEQLAERVGDRTEYDEAVAEMPLGEGGWPEGLLEALERVDPWEWDGWLWADHPELWLHPHYPQLLCLRMGPPRVRLLWSAIEAARKVRAIALAAFHRGIPVRWFEYDVTAPSGGRSELQPVNARAVARSRPMDGRLLDQLALTVANRESIVFWSQGTDDFPGVLFTADSDLQNVQLPRDLAGAIATTPHHGSEANAKAYRVVAAATDPTKLTWVRSDGRFRSRPGPTYLAIRGRRFCTICRLPDGGSSVKRAVHLFARRGRWTPQASTWGCNCK